MKLEIRNNRVEYKVKDKTIILDLEPLIIDELENIKNILGIVEKHINMIILPGTKEHDPVLYYTLLVMISLNIYNEVKRMIREDDKT